MERRVALVTGGGRGIGRGIVLALAEAGLDVAVNYAGRADAAADTVMAARRLGARAETVQADVSHGPDRARLLAEVERQFGRLDVLVNNAGVAPERRVDLLEATEDSFERIMAINLRGPFFLTQQAARWMIRQAEADPGRRPVIVNISSISAYASSPSRGDYCLSKAGIGMMTRLYAHRLAPHGISVYEVRPGIIATDMTAGVREKYDAFFREGGVPLARWGQPADVGKAVAALAVGMFPYSTGEVINVDGGFHLHRL